MKELSALALDTARNLGATYADIRIINLKTEDIQVRNSRVSLFEQSERLGAGIRVIADGAWGFASTAQLSRDEIVKTTRLAVEIARSSATLKKDDIQLTKEKTYVDFWQTPYLIDPFAVSKDEKIDLLFKIDHILCKNKAIKESISGMSFRREHQLLSTSEGSFIEQILLHSGAGYSATAVGFGDIQTRSFPAPFGGQYCSMGYELIKSLPLLENAERIRSEAIALLKAPLCPSGKKDLILGGAQLALQIHESVGHPTELDRVLGMEESYAGRSFLTTEKYGNYRFGNDIVNLVADGTVPGGLATVGYDDDGVKAQRWHLVRNGIFCGYQTNRELAIRIAEGKSMGCCRADGFSRIPMIRNNNISLMPGTYELDDLIKNTKNGIYMDMVKSWSIDQMRLNFQFGCEIGWEIKNGKKTRMVKYPTYQGISPEFWASCDAICNDNHWVLWGLPNCAKGEPAQTSAMSHGCSPARFRNVTIGMK